MAQSPTKRLARLRAVQVRARDLAGSRPWFADACRRAFWEFVALKQRFVAEQAAMRWRERQLARELLAAGRLFDPRCREGHPCLFVRINGLCPAALADRLKEHPRGKLPASLEREGAAAALAALGRETSRLPDGQHRARAAEARAATAAGTHARFTWRIIVARPSDWQGPADPHSLRRSDLQRLTEQDYRTISLYRLGGLADTGALRPIVPAPAETGTLVKDMSPYLAWHSRYPVAAQDRNGVDPVLHLGIFPPEVAEQMMNDVERWANQVESFGQAVRGILHRDHAELAAELPLGGPASGAVNGRGGPAMQSRLDVAMSRAAQECPDGHEAWLEAGRPPVNLDPRADLMLTVLPVTQGERTTAASGPLAPPEDGAAAPPPPGPVRQRAEPDVVVLWPGAPHTKRNINLARTRTAYLEAGGNVAGALEALKASGNGIGRSTIYDHLAALDKAHPGWRKGVLCLESGASGIPDGTRKVRSRRKLGAKPR